MEFLTDRPPKNSRKRVDTRIGKGGGTVASVSNDELQPESGSTADEYEVPYDEMAGMLAFPIHNGWVWRERRVPRGGGEDEVWRARLSMLPRIGLEYCGSSDGPGCVLRERGPSRSLFREHPEGGGFIGNGVEVDVLNHEIRSESSFTLRIHPARRRRAG